MSDIFDEKPHEKLQRIIHQDPELKALRKLRDVQTDPVEKLEIQNFIDERLAELTESVLII